MSTLVSTVLPAYKQTNGSYIATHESALEQADFTTDVPAFTSALNSTFDTTNKTAYGTTIIPTSKCTNGSTIASTYGPT